MTGPEFTEMAKAIQSRWFAFAIPKAGLEQYGSDLRDLDFEKAMAAVAALGTDGMDRAPTSMQIRRKVAELELDAPSWTDARSALLSWRRDRPRRESTTAAWTCPRGVCEGNAWVHDDETNTARECECRPQYLAAARGLDVLTPLLREFVAERHVQPGEIDILLEGGDTTLEAQVRQRWSQYIGRAIESRALAGLPGTAGLARLEAARVEDEERPERVVEHRDRGPRRMTNAAELLMQRAGQ